MAHFKKIPALFFCLALTGSCAGGPAAFAATDQFPLDTRALDAVLVDKSTGKTIDAGRVPYAGGPGHRRDASMECREMAAEKAKKERIADWDYYCCTVTAKSDCTTKVKELF